MNAVTLAREYDNFFVSLSGYRNTIINQSTRVFSLSYFLNCGYEIKWSYDPSSYERSFSNCVEKPEKFRTSTGYEPVTSRFGWDALTNWLIRPLTLGAGDLWFLMFSWGMNQRWNDIWNRSYVELSIRNQVKLWSLQYWTQFATHKRPHFILKSFCIS